MPKQHELATLSEDVKQIIYGSVLGDGSLKINPKYKNARLAFRHSSIQKNYFDWKVKALASVTGQKSVWEQPPALGSSMMLRYQSSALPSLSEIHSEVTQKNTKSIRRRWLNIMSPLALAIWWLDDGSLVKNTKQGVFCTDSFSEAEVKILARYLQVVWGVNTKILTISGRENQFRLLITSVEELKKFFRLIAPYVLVKEMLYKIIILYKDLESQQRWISELEELTIFNRATIEQAVAERKKKLKAFSEKDIVQPSL